MVDTASGSPHPSSRRLNVLEHYMVGIFEAQIKNRERENAKIEEFI